MGTLDPTLDREMLARIRRLEIKTRRLVSNSFAGAYHSTFKGRGIAFESVRPYEPGDDVRDIEWHVTARTGEPYIKQHTEDRELTVMLVFDASSSGAFGTQGQYKRDRAAELGAVLALTAVSNNDKVGLLLVSDRIERFIAPRKGRNHVLRVIRDLLVPVDERRGTDLALAIRTANRLLTQRAIIFVISDFLADGYMTELRVANRRHDVIAVVLSDPREQHWPDVGMVALRDAETNAAKVIDTASSRWRSQFEESRKHAQMTRDRGFDGAQISRIDITTDTDIVAALMRFFRRRSR